MSAARRDITANFLAAYSWPHRADPDLTAEPAGGMVCCHAPAGLTDFNVALPVPEAIPDPASPRFLETTRRVRSFFQARGTAFSCWSPRGEAPAPAPRSLGFSARADYMSQSLDLRHAPALSGSPQAHGALTVRRAATPGELEAFADLVAAGWSLPPEPYRRFFSRQARRLLAAGCPKHIHIGWIDQTPVCCMELFVQPDSGVAGVYYLATHSAFRRRGHALDMQARVLEEIRLAGFRTAVVVSEPGERRIMTRLGFTDQGLWHEYIQGDC